MKSRLVILVGILLCSIGVFGQKSPVVSSSPSPETAASPAASGPLDIAKAAVAAHGGEKLRNVKSLVMKGSADLNVFNQQLPGAFSLAFNGNKYYFEINATVQQFKQVYDGERFYSSIAGFSLPPVTSIGFPVLMHVGETGYVVAALPDTAKKKKGFRMTTPEGFVTDFFVDEKTGRIKGYVSSFVVNDRSVTTSVEIDDVQTVDGVVVPSKYSQRFDLGQITAYANLKAKEVLVNSPIEDSAFAIPK